MTPPGQSAPGEWADHTALADDSPTGPATPSKRTYEEIIRDRLRKAETLAELEAMIAEEPLVDSDDPTSRAYFRIDELRARLDPDGDA